MKGSVFPECPSVGGSLGAVFAVRAIVAAARSRGEGGEPSSTEGALAEFDKPLGSLASEEPPPASPSVGKTASAALEANVSERLLESDPAASAMPAKAAFWTFPCELWGATLVMRGRRACSESRAAEISFKTSPNVLHCAEVSACNTVVCSELARTASWARMASPTALACMAARREGGCIGHRTDSGSEASEPGASRLPDVSAQREPGSRALSSPGISTCEHRS
mmetsp:Transcript_40886/g.101613  ORF Transcript_40886/g.101613 Transcript_40886/m.101613 type:complete len:224 (-) Transcript_40886:5111-5782(-)